MIFQINTIARLFKASVITVYNLKVLHEALSRQLTYPQSSNNRIVLDKGFAPKIRSSQWGWVKSHCFHDHSMYSRSGLQSIELPQKPLSLAPISHKSVVLWRQKVELRFASSPKYSLEICVTEIVLLMIIPSLKFLHKPKAMLWAHGQSFSLKFLP